MKIVSAKCPNCGGILEVDSEKDAAICQFCQTPFIVEKAIENYNITNNYTTVNQTITNITGQEVHVHQDGESAEQLFENIKALLNRKEYKLAETTYEKLKEKYPTDYRVDETIVLFVLNGYDLRGLSSNKWCRQFAGYENLRLIPMDYFIVVLNKLKKLNKEAYATYYNELLNEVNKRLSRDFDKVLHGKMLLSKVYVDKLMHEGYRGEHHGLNELITKFNMLDKIIISSNYNAGDSRSLVTDIDYINRQLSLRAKDMKQNCYTTRVNEDNYEYSYQNGSVIEDEGTDDDYLISLISILNNILSKI